MAYGRVNGARLAELRRPRSREVIAHALRSRGFATDAKAIWRWENGRNQPSASILPAYAEVLGAADISELYGDSDDEEEAAPVETHHDMLAALAVAFDRFHPRNAEKVAS